MSVKDISLYGRHFANGEPVRVRIRGDRIAGVDPAWPKSDLESWPYVSPSLFDLQINGYGGTWFSDDSLKDDAVLRTLEPFFAMA